MKDYKETEGYNMNKCPICNKEYSERPALSRRDNKTLICPACGMNEALEDAEKHTCIFEKRLCEYANKDGRSFNCTAPSDEAMTCR